MDVIRILFVFLLIFGLALSSCTKEVTPLKQITIEELMSHGIAIHPDTDENALLHQLGIPLERCEETTNQYNLDYRSNHISYIYPGLVIYYVQSNSEVNNWKKIISITVTSDCYLLDYGVHIGMRQAEIYERFGRPPFNGIERDGAFQLDYPNLSSESGYPIISFILKNDSLTSISWQAYI